MAISSWRSSESSGYCPDTTPGTKNKNQGNIFIKYMANSQYIYNKAPEIVGFLLNHPLFPVNLICFSGTT
jgi:hypothetical protein